MNRRRVLIVLGSIGATGLAGTAGYEYWSYRRMTLRRNLLVAGSRAAEEFVQAAAKEFARANPDMDIVVEGGNATAGLLALRRDSISLAIMSRDLTTAEDRPNLHSTLLGMEGVAIVVHPSMAVESMTSGQVHGVLAGDITNWSELNGPDMPIVLFGRSQGSSARATIEEALMRGTAFTRSMTVMENAKSLNKAVASEPKGLGFVNARNLDGTTKAVAIDGHDVNEKNVLLRRYPLTRDLYLVSNSEGSSEAMRFVQYCVSRDGQKLMASLGLNMVR